MKKVYVGDNDGIARKIFPQNSTFLLNNGDQCTSVTGGWATRKWGISTMTGAPTLPRVSYKDNYYTLSLDGGQQQGVWQTGNDINLTSFSKLYVHMSGYYIGAQGFSSYCVITGRTGNYVDTNEVKRQLLFFAATSTSQKEITFPAQDFEIDVSDITGSYDVLFYFRIGVAPIKASLSINKVWLE